MIKLIIFDLWETLAYKNVEYSATKKINDAIRNKGIRISLEETRKIFERATQLKRWRKKENAYSELCRALGIEPTQKNISLFRKIRDHAESRTRVYKHTTKMLKSLKNQGYKLALLSNSSTFMIHELKKRSDILKYFHYKIFSYNIGTIKPDPKMFKEALKRAGCRPEESLMIGDNPKDDIVPARKLGINTIRFRDYEQLKKDLRKYGIEL